jgi:hypothetical protein
MFLGMKFWYYPNFTYYLNFVKFASGKDSRFEYASKFNERAKWYPDLISFIKRSTGPKDKIFVWGTEPAIYYLSGRIPATRYTVSYHITELSAQGEVLDQLERDLPVLVIMVKNESKFEALEELLNQQYAPAGSFGDTQVFRKLNRIKT